MEPWGSNKGAEKPVNCLQWLWKAHILPDTWSFRSAWFLQSSDHLSDDTHIADIDHAAYNEK